MTDKEKVGAILDELGKSVDPAEISGEDGTIDFIKFGNHPLVRTAVEKLIFIPKSREIIRKHYWVANLLISRYLNNA